VQPAVSHGWSLDAEQARKLQAKMAALVVSEDRLPERIRTVAGVDAAYAGEGTDAFAAVAVIDVASNCLEELVAAEEPVRFPYVPGLLSFREIPVLAAALKKLSVRPDLLICDGQGIMHPRRFGLACHLGVIYDLPTIGCAKTHLVGSTHEPGFERGNFSSIVYNGETVGALLRTRNSVRPLYVSPGHRISLRTACDWTLMLCQRYRIPEPIRIAHQVVTKKKQEAAIDKKGSKRGTVTKS